MSSSRDRDLVYVAQPDWWSRLVAVGALAVAGTALYWSYLQGQKQTAQVTDQTAEIKTAVANGLQSIRDSGGQERQQLDAYLTALVTKFDEHVASQLTPRTASPPANTEFEEPIASLGGTDDTAAAEPPTPARSTPADSLALSSPMADLVEVFAVLRVDDLDSRPTLIVRNRGKAAGTVTHVRFEPTVDFDQVPLAVAGMKVGETRSDRLVIRFQPADNRAANPKLQGTYEQTISQPFEIAPDREVEVQVVIENREHRGFGLRGRLTLLSDGRELGTFENVAIPFVTGA